MIEEIDEENRIKRKKRVLVRIKILRNRFRRSANGKFKRDTRKKKKGSEVEWPGETTRRMKKTKNESKGLGKKKRTKKDENRERFSK